MELVLPSPMFFDPQSETQRKQESDTGLAEKTKIEKRLFCSTCRHVITHQDERIPVQGGHEHRCTNPLGIRYHIGCFREAAGCPKIA